VLIAGVGHDQNMDVPCARWTAPAKADEVGRMRRAAAAVAAEHGLDGVALEHFELAVSEALTNVVLHAYPRTSGPMSVEIESDEDEIRVMVADQGEGIVAQPSTVGSASASGSSPGPPTPARSVPDGASESR
jgi:anti-sigma regulatory factor (Ser/Thr protein kinase)